MSSPHEHDASPPAAASQNGLASPPEKDHRLDAGNKHHDHCAPDSPLDSVHGS